MYDILYKGKVGEMNFLRSVSSDTLKKRVGYEGVRKKSDFTKILV